MVDSQSRFGKPSWSGETLKGEGRDQERAVEFQFSVTWSTVFAPSSSPKTADAVVPVSNRVPTLVTSPKEAPPPRDERALMKQNVEELTSPPRQKIDPTFNVAWEMVVPKMVRSVPKTPAPEQIAESSAPATSSLTTEKNDAMAALLSGEEKKWSPLADRRVIVAFAITIVGILALLLLHHFWPHQKQAPPPPAHLASPLKLEVQPETNGLVDVRWNPGSPVVAQAREARLVIMERDQQPKTLTLSADQLKSGHLPFQPLGDRVVFRLEIVDRSGALTKESVLTQASSTPVAPPIPVPTQPAMKQTPAAKAPRASDADEDGDSGRAAKLPASQATRTPARAFAPPPASQRNTKDGRPILPDPPAVLPNASSASSIRIPDPGERAGIFPPAPAKQGAPASIPAGGNLQPGKLIKKVTPIYPSVAESSRVQGIVRFNATIGKDGTIRDLKVVSGPSLLVSAATEAVKQWVYEPTKLNGNPVEVQTQINVSFTLGK